MIVVFCPRRAAVSSHPRYRTKKLLFAFGFLFSFFVFSHGWKKNTHTYASPQTRRSHPSFVSRFVLLACVKKLERFLILPVVGVGFMVLMCLGALACCVHKGSQPPEENVMVS